MTQAEIVAEREEMYPVAYEILDKEADARKQDQAVTTFEVSLEADRAPKIANEKSP
ncbi:hypothetical protein [Neorhizobium sp. T6_25]|jgi:hypothetical protein|uniref:hypothetical protein n=1 Tax=Neorhizobium sp. T6_25 TaxID=2093833 RepID=UPI00155EBF4E|nr:hypothetical protein [Neorhizobium sp. T6_25]